MVNVTDAREYLQKVLNLTNAVTVITYNGYECENFDERIMSVMEAEDINIITGIGWVCVRRDGQEIFQTQDERIYYDAEMPDGRTISITSDAGRDSSVLVDYNRISSIEQKNIGVPAINIYVYNNIAGELTETRIINMKTGEFID